MTVRRIVTLLNSTRTSGNPKTCEHSQLFVVKAKEIRHNRICARRGPSLSRRSGMSFLYIPLLSMWLYFLLTSWKCIRVCVCVCVCACVCVSGENEWADIDEGHLSSETYGTVCNFSSQSMIIKTIVLCDDLRSLLTSGFVCLCLRMCLCGYLCESQLEFETILVRTFRESEDILTSSLFWHLLKASLRVNGGD